MRVCDDACVRTCTEKDKTHVSLKAFCTESMPSVKSIVPLDLSLIHAGLVIASYEAADAIKTRTNDGQFTLNDFAR